MVATLDKNALNGSPSCGYSQLRLMFLSMGKQVMRLPDAGFCIKAFSPMFTLVADGLNTIFCRVTEASLILGLKASSSCSLANFHYANDTVLFSEIGVEQAIVLMWILCSYELCRVLKLTSTRVSFSSWGFHMIKESLGAVRELFLSHIWDFPFACID